MARLDNHLTQSEKQARNRTFDKSRIYMAEVMDTRSILRGGEIKVWILSSNNDKTNPHNWVTAYYASPSYGTTPVRPNQTNIDAPVSFGWWNPMPYVGNYVFIFYACISGENSNPYWFSCPVNPNMNFMLPGIPGAYTSDNHDALCEINMKSTNPDVNSDVLAYRKEQYQAPYKPIIDALKRQGLDKDKLRGISTAGSKRESPSMCSGYTSPTGHSFVIDDGWLETDNKTNWLTETTDPNILGLKGDNGKDPSHIENSYRYDSGFRFRTRNGTQILILDNGNIYMINRDGTAWVELSDDGYIDCYSKRGISANTDGDINFHSGGRIKMEAKQGFTFKTDGDISVESAGNINVSAPRIDTDSIITAPEIDTNIGNIESFISASAQINGTFSGTLQGIAEYATNAGITPAPQPIPLTPSPEVPYPVIEQPQEQVGKIGETISTIVSRIPTAEPYGGHDRNNTIPELDTSFKVPTTEYYTSTPTIISNQIETTPLPTASTENSPIPSLQLSEHFTLQDLCYSSTASKLGINNTPPSDIIEKLRYLAINGLEPIYKQFGKLTINSGYRGTALNVAVGGASTSQHCKGEAADIEVLGVNNYDLAVWIRDNLEFDQLILEFATNLSSDPNSGWVHLSLKSANNRHQLLTIDSSGTKSGLLK